MKLKDKDDGEWMKRIEHKVLFFLYVSYLEARRGGKRGTFDEHKFEVNEFENLIRLRDLLLAKKYIPTRGTAHIIHNPVIREIFAAGFRDRVLHHLIYDVIYDWWEKMFLFCSFSCREGKGTLLGVQMLQRHIQAASNNYRDEVYVIKLDIQGYFMSIAREKLYERAMWGLDRQFKGNHNWLYELVKYALEQTIFDDPCRGVKKKGWPEAWRPLPKSKSLFLQPKGVGIVIGNLTSQLLSNIFLDMLDRFIYFDLGYKYYGRYVDDFYFVVKKSELPKAIKDIEKIEAFLKEMGLTLHPKKRYIQPAKNGVPFLGAIVYPGRIQMGQRLKKNTRKAFREVAEGRRGPETVASYLGHAKHMRSKKFMKEAFDELGWDYRG